MTKKIIILICFLFLAIRLFYIGNDILNSDGARWYKRTEGFVAALKAGDLASTYQHYQPGVSLMLVNSIARQVSWKVQDFIGQPRWSLENSGDFIAIHTVSKLVLVVVLFGLFLAQLSAISKLFGLKVAIVYGLVMSIEPYIVGIDRWFHLTALETYASFLGFLLYLLYLSSQKAALAVGSGLAFGISILAKISGLVGAAAAAILSVGGLVYKFVKTKEIKYFYFTGLAVFTGTALLTIVLLFPALWVDAGTVIQNVFAAVTDAVDNSSRGRYFAPPFSYIYYLVILAFKLNPVALFAVVLAIAMLLHSSRTPGGKKAFAILGYIGLLFVVYTFADKKIDRYVYALMQPLLLVIALGLAQVKTNLLKPLLVVYLAVNVYSYYGHFPVMSGYYSPLFGGAQAALSMGIFDNSGEYMLQAARYLNGVNATEGNRAKVYVPRDLEPFKYTYGGPSVSEFEPGTKYLIKKLGITREETSIVACDKVVTEFGPRYGVPYVYILACR